MFNIDPYAAYHKYGCVHIHSETYEHFKAKCDCAWEIHKKGHKVGTEIKLTDGTIIDVMDITTGEKFEIVKSHKPDRKDDITWIQI